MKRFFISLGMMVAATLSLTNCNKDYVETAPTCSDEFTINASCIDTKTVNDGMNTTWKENDAVAVFHAVAGTTDYVLDGKFVTEAGDGQFKGTLASALDDSKTYDWYMVYPYNDKITTPANTTAYSYIGNRAYGLNQSGNDSMAHVCGSSFTLVGKSTSVTASSVPSVSMKNVASLAAIKVTNSTPSAFTVTKVTFDAVDEDIVGSYYVNFADIDNVVCTPSEGYAVATSVVNVKDGASIAAGESATFYAAVKPYTAAAGKAIKVKVDGVVGANAASFEKTINITSPVTFNAGRIKTVNVAVTSMSSAGTSDKTLSEVISEGEYTVRNVTVMATNGSYAIIKDATGLGFIFKNSHGLKVKDVIDIVGGTVKLYNGAYEFTDGTFTKKSEAASVDHGTAEEYNAAYQTSYSASPSVKYVHVIGTVAEDGRLVQASDGAAVYLPSKQTSNIGKIVEVYGYLTGWASSKGNASMVHVTVKEYVDPSKPQFGVSTEKIVVDYNATTASFTVYGNVDWTATSLSSGLEIDNTSGNGKATITATFPANTSSDAVEYTISVETASAVSPNEFEITIHQNGAPEAGTIESVFDLTTYTAKSVSEDKVEWAVDGFTMTSVKGTSSVSANNYLGGDANNRTSSRVYNGMTFTITPPSAVTISEIAIVTTSDNYATALGTTSTWSNASVTAGGSLVTVVPTDSSKPIVCSVKGTSGIKTVTIRYTK